MLDHDTDSHYGWMCWEDVCVETAAELTFQCGQEVGEGPGT